MKYVKFYNCYFIDRIAEETDKQNDHNSIFIPKISITPVSSKALVFIFIEINVRIF